MQVTVAEVALLVMALQPVQTLLLSQDPAGHAVRHVSAMAPFASPFFFVVPDAAHATTREVRREVQVRAVLARDPVTALHAGQVSADPQAPTVLK